MDDLNENIIFCNHCRAETKHHLNTTYTRRREYLSGKLVFISSIGDSKGESNETDEFDETINSLWICSGCNDITLEVRSTNSSAVERDGSYIYSVRLYPEREETKVYEKRFYKIPQKLHIIYGEIIEAFNKESFVLCAIGLRTLIEGIAADLDISERNLERKIDGLNHVLPENIVKNLHNLRFMGNEAAHEITAPSEQELRLAIDICEDILNFLYDLNYKATNLSTLRKIRKNK